MVGIYGIYNKLSDKWYIGQSWNITKRLNRHRRDLNTNKHDNVYLQKSWNLHGESSFEFHKIEHYDLITQSGLDEKEKFWIKLMESFSKGYNMTVGGNGGCSGYKHTKEHKKKLKEICHFIGKAGKLNKKSLTCYKYCKTTGKLLDLYESFNLAAKQNKLKKQNVLQAKDRAILCGGFYWSDKLFSNFIEESEELNNTIQKRRLTKRKKCSSIMALNKDGSIFKEFECIYDAFDFFGKDRNSAKSNIMFALNGRYKTAYGYVWKYKGKSKIKK